MGIEIVHAADVPECFEQMLTERGPEERACVLTMSVDFSTDQILKSLVSHGRPGDVFAVSRFGHRYGLTPRLGMYSGLRAASAPLHHLGRAVFKREFKGSYVVLNPKDSPLLNQSHIKAFGVGDSFLSCGGVNADASSFFNTDLLLLFTSAEYGNFVDDFIEKRGGVHAGPKNGVKIELDPQNKVLIDYGTGSSLILESVVEDMRRKQVESVVTSANYIPTGLYRDEF